MTQVHFKDVGRQKHSWTATTDKEISGTWLLEQVKAHLISNDLEFDCAADGSDGHIFAGCNEVGSFTITNVKP